jgi:hypothetical protein
MNDDARNHEREDNVFMFSIYENMVLQNPPIIYTHPVYSNEWV